MNKTINKIKSWVLIWIWFSLTTIIVSITFAATIWTVWSWSTLTDTLWNTLVWQVNENTAPPVFSAELSSNQSPTTLSLITAWTEHVDNRNAFSAWVYTVPKAWKYKIAFGWLFNHAWSTTYYWFLHLLINDIGKWQGHTSRTWNSEFNSISSMNRIYDLNQWDTIKLQWFVINGAAFFYDGELSFFTIEYIWE